MVAGLGSEYRRDDGAGPAVAARAVEQAPAAYDIGPLVDPLDLLGRWDGADLAVVDRRRPLRGDAGHGPGGRADRSGGELGPGRATSTHGIGLAGVLRLARAVDQAPGRVVVVGIEGEDFGRGTGSARRSTPRSPWPCERSSS